MNKLSSRACTALLFALLLFSNVFGALKEEQTTSSYVATSDQLLPSSKKTLIALVIGGSVAAGTVTTLTLLACCVCRAGRKQGGEAAETPDGAEIEMQNWSEIPWFQFRNAMDLKEEESKLFDGQSNGHFFRKYRPLTTSQSIVDQENKTVKIGPKVPPLNLKLMPTAMSPQPSGSALVSPTGIAGGLPRIPARVYETVLSPREGNYEGTPPVSEGLSPANAPLHTLLSPHANLPPAASSAVREDDRAK
jgi:hypothetical protein